MTTMTKFTRLSYLATLVFTVGCLAVVRPIGAHLPLGALTTGGLDGVVLRVTTLDGDGPGSLRQALDDPRPRLVVFEVGGVIDLQGKALTVRNPFVTIAGQTA
jgi:hypothetical protein